MGVVPLLVGLGVTVALEGGLGACEETQVYVLPPVAVKVKVCAEHNAAAEPVIVGFNPGLTVTTTGTGNPGQVPFNPMTVYVVVELGFAVTEAPEVALSPVAGVQV